MIKWLLKKIAGKILASVVIFAVVAGALFFLGNNLSQASLDRLDLRDIKEISTDSFTVEGDFFVNNPSKLSIPVKSIDYEIILKETEEVLSSGSIPSFILEVGESQIPFEQKVRWVPTAELALQLATEEHVYAVVEGKIIIDLPKLESYELPFSEEVDIKDYVKQFVTDKLPVGPDIPGAGNGTILPVPVV